jgi:hypothetical protein
MRRFGYLLPTTQMNSWVAKVELQARGGVASHMSLGMPRYHAQVAALGSCV